jgi:hypothetical protein
MQPPNLQRSNKKEYVECPRPISSKNDYFCC